MIKLKKQLNFALILNLLLVSSLAQGAPPVAPQPAAAPAIAAPAAAPAAPVVAPAPTAPAAAAPAASAPVTYSQGNLGEAKKVDVNTLKKRYWGLNEGQELKVVQNRSYTKAGRLNLALLGGSLANDPFIVSYTYGAMLGYNINEYFAINAVYWRASNSPSSAATALLQEAQQYAGNSIPTFGPNTNQVNSMIGGELNWSVLYGKLSLLGMAILHFDLYLFGGAGMLGTCSGNYFTPWFGVGQQFFITHWLALRVDYRMHVYNENIYSLYGTNIGALQNARTTFAGAFTLGINFLLF